MRKKFWLITAVCAIAVIFFILLAYSTVYDRLALVEKGLASPKFPYLKYSQDELNKMYPQYANENVATTRSPEQTHKLFVDNLKKGDINSAVECCFKKGDWDKMKGFLNEVKDKGYWDVLVSDLSVIKKDFIGDSIAAYTYTSKVDDKNYANNMSFTKDSNGIWLIESL